MRALIVDDNSTTPGVLREMLCRLGMKPTCVESGTGSAGFLGELWPLLPADFRRWPNAGHGWIRSDRGDPEITGFLRMHHHDADFRALGIAAYLVKAIHQSELLEAICRGTSAKPGGENAAPLVTRHSLREGGNKWRILCRKTMP
jgi:hypothetical protein